MPEQTIIVEQYVTARKKLEECGFTVVIRDGAAFQVRSIEGPERVLWTTADVEKLAVFAEGVSLGYAR